MRLQRMHNRRAGISMLLAFSIAALAGCAAEVTVKNGETYYGDSKVQASGTLEAIRLYGKNQSTHLLARGNDGRLYIGTEKAGDISRVANDNMPYHSFSNSLVVDALALIFMSLKGSQNEPGTPAPAYSDLLIRLPDGELRTLSLMNDRLKQQIKNGCVEVGEPIMIVAGYRNAWVPVHADARLQRPSDLLPSCATLRARYGYPVAETVWD